MASSEAHYHSSEPEKCRLDMNRRFNLDVKLTPLEEWLKEMGIYIREETGCCLQRFTPADVDVMPWLSTDFRSQKYGSLKKDLVKKGELFVDPEFPPNNKSLFFSKVDSEIEWKRPKELCKVPRLVVGGVACEDLNEGELGNTWFVAACYGLAQNQLLWKKIVPDSTKQEWTEENQYAGIFQFSFWRYGQWINVVVDDLLPTKNNKLIFCHSSSRNEFWSALLEKAYAKLYGDYESLGTGYTVDALVDFTGGVAERVDLALYDLESLREDFFQNISSASDNKALIGCVYKCEKDEVSQELSQGLLKGRGYAVTRVLDVNVPKGLRQDIGADKLRVLRLRNPWRDSSWTGKWSEESPEWKQLSLRDRENMGMIFSSEDEFWMGFDDFVSIFSHVEICHSVNTSFFTLKKTWNESMVHGEWTLGPTGSKKDRSGGSVQNAKTFLANPQISFDITGREDNIMVSLEQDDTNVGHNTGQQHLPIGFLIMKVEENRLFRVHIPGTTMASTEFARLRSVFHRMALRHGRYVIIPSTSDPEMTGKFLLRVYTSNSANVRELTEDSPGASGPICCTRPYVMATRVRVIKADALESKPNAETMVIAKCEGETVKSDWVKDTVCPMWNFEVLFYRQKPMEEPIIIEVVNHKSVSNEFLGQTVIADSGNEEAQEIELDLYGKKKEAEVRKPGKITVEVISSDDLTAL